MVAAPVAPERSSTAWLAELAGSPLPNRRQEDWRFTELSALEAVPGQLAAVGDPWASLALPPGVSRLDPARTASMRQMVLQASGAADHWPVRLHGGALAAVAAAPSGAAAPASGPLLALRVEGVVPEPLVLEQPPLAAGLTPAQLVLVLEPGAELELLQVVAAGEAGPALLSGLTAVHLGAGARLKAGLLALGSSGHCLLAHWSALQEPGSRLELVTACAGWELLRFEPRLVQRAGGASTRLRALQLAAGHQRADTHSYVRFDGPDGELDQLHKAIAAGHGHSIFNGAVQVPRVAQRTNAAQLSRSLLLSERARIDTKPELEIVADDVKCAHGATVSRLRQDELFYLQSRGIAADQAAALLKRAYCEEVLRDLPAAAAGWNPLERLLAGS